MKVKVIFYGVLREEMGMSEMVVDLGKSSASLGDLISHLESQHPRLKNWLKDVAFAVEDRIVGRSELLREGVEVALLPPVSGG